MLEITDCDKLYNNKFFRESFGIDLSNTSPNNLVEAVVLLDSLSTSTFNHRIEHCDIITFHMDLGMCIRNSWIYPNEDFENNFNEFNITHPDHVSSLILNTYKVYIRDGKVDFLAFANEGVEELIESMPESYKVLENELNLLKGYSLDSLK